MNLNKIKEDVNPKLKSLKWFGVSFVAVFSLLWLFIEPLGFSTILGDDYYKNHKTLVYLIFVGTSLIFSIIYELSRRMLLYQKHTKSLINYISFQIPEFSEINVHVNKEEISRLLQSIKIKGFQLTDLETNRHKSVFLHNLFMFFEWLDLTEIRENNYFPNNELAMLYIRSLGAHLSEEVNLFEGLARPEADALNKEMRSLLKLVEKRRKERNVSAETIREVNASMIILKAKNEKGEDVFLMQHSKSWNEGYYWWIGGIREDKDSDADACARRELNEELNIEERHISSLEYLGQCSEMLISSRLGAYSNYNYDLYLLNIKEHETISQLFALKNKIKVPSQHDLVKRKIKWFTWSELSENEELKRDSKSIFDLIEKVGAHNTRISTNQIIK